MTPDVALLEDGFSDVTASEMLAAVTAENLPTRLVFYTASVARGDIADAVAAGACTAIPMREEPETLFRSLRLVAPTADRAAIRKPGKGACGENGLAASTDLERKILRLVACGMSNKEIARQLNVATGTIKARVDHMSAQSEIKNRTELATFALSRLYGRVGALAALIWAALDDVQPASASAVHHALTDSVTVMAADDTGAVVTIKISPPKTTAASGKTARAVGKADRAENSGADIPTRGSKLIESRADIAASTITSPALNPPRSSISDFGGFMLMAVGVSIYELLNSPAQAFTFWDSFASAAENATSELGALNMPGSADATLNELENLARLNPEGRHESFVFEAGRSDAIGKSDEHQIVDAAASEHSVGAGGNPHVGSGAIDAPIDHSGFEQAAATDASRNAEHGTIHATAADGSNDEQSQRDLHVSEQGAAAGKPHAGDRPPGDDPDHGQSQRDLHISEHGAAADKQPAKHDSTGHDSDWGQSHRDLDASEEGSATADQHAKDDVQSSHFNSGQSQADLPKVPISGSKTLHAGPDQNATAAAPQFEDSFHFKNDRAEVRVSENSGNGHGPDAVEYTLHDAGKNGLALIQDADLIGPSHAEQSALDHASVEHHLTHDLFV
ncbi:MULTISPECIES: response regulator transcription factor [unclassified Bradyrhizobium]|uniref:LuxR C-terminal-related transcriptional regulator n=1 Tax=unclassified Bradyrhizobium TaxID=2631580 RepID=UPI001FF912EC|nr:MULTISPECIES: response regulator transcription factor [unclassified Bradyrhizobium]MCK1420612.1 response regulator transcription factor [Bradyrhizobium sp. CW12]MCK1647209.1 response regulator transcription factor [Bradyrhizobium sp. 154]